MYYIVARVCCNYSAMYILFLWVYDLLDCLNTLSIYLGFYRSATNVEEGTDVTDEDKETDNEGEDNDDDDDTDDSRSNCSSITQVNMMARCRSESNGDYLAEFRARDTYTSYSKYTESRWRF